MANTHRQQNLNHQVQQIQTLIQSQQRIANLIALRTIDRRIFKQPKIKIDITRSQYKLLKTIALNSLGWRLWARQDQKDDANIIWVDHYVSQDFVRKMKPYQKINHFPNSYLLGRKDFLAQNLNAANKIMPKQYNFYPKTWILPQDSVKFQKFRKKNSNALFIIKPPASSQGRGIYISHNVDAQDIQNLLNNDTFNKDFNNTWSNGFFMNYGVGNDLSQKTVVQSYVDKPLLIDGMKFDFRLYVLVKSLSPLKIFLYSQGLTRLATHKYEAPNSKNLSDMYMHLTNYAINKNSPQYLGNKHEQDDHIGHKRTYTATMQKLYKQNNCDIQKVQEQIDSLIVKTILSSHQKLLESYKSVRNCRQEYSSVCFQIYGFDIMLTQDYQPILIQVNHSPSFTAGSPLDTIIKKYLLLDTLNLLNIDNNQKIQYMKRPTQQNGDRYTIPKPINFKKIILDQNEYQRQHLGAYRKIYPLPYQKEKSSLIKNILPKSSDNKHHKNNLINLYKQILNKLNQKQQPIYFSQSIQMNQANPQKYIKSFGKTEQSFKSRTIRKIDHESEMLKNYSLEHNQNQTIKQNLKKFNRNKNQDEKFKSQQDYINFTFYKLFANNDILNEEDEYNAIFSQQKNNKFPVKMNNVNISFYGHKNKKKLKQIRHGANYESQDKNKTKAQLWFRQRIYQTELRSRLNKMKVARVRLQKVHKQQRSIQKQNALLGIDFRKING